MPHPRGNRSLEGRQKQARKEQRRAARKFILLNSFNDVILAEKVSRTDHRTVLTYLGTKYDMVFPEVAMSVERGEVLVDSRGNGTFQKVIK